MSGGMELSRTAAHINELCARGGEIYLHKASGVRYRIAYSLGGANELHPISGPCRYATDDQLADSEVWEKKP